MGAQEKQCVDGSAVVGTRTPMEACARARLGNAANVMQVLEAMEDVWCVGVGHRAIIDLPGTLLDLCKCWRRWRTPGAGALGAAVAACGLLLSRHLQWC